MVIVNLVNPPRSSILVNALGQARKWFNGRLQAQTSPKGQTRGRNRGVYLEADQVLHNLRYILDSIKC